MKLGAFRIRPLPGGGYLDCIFSLMQSSPVLGSYFIPRIYSIVAAELVVILFCKLRVGLHPFSICQQCPFVYAMKQDKNCSSSECSNTMQDAHTNESRRRTWPLYCFVVETYLL